MKCNLTVGELTTALQLAKITLDKKVGADFSSVYLAAKKGRAGNNRLVIHSSDTTSRTLLRIPCNVDEVGVLITDPLRLSSILDHRDPGEMVHFTSEKSGRTTLRVGSGRVSLSSADAKTGLFESSMDLFPHAQEPLFEIGAPNLQSLLERTAEFTYSGDGKEHLKVVRIRSVEGGYESVCTNAEVAARATVADEKSPGLENQVEVQIPQHAIQSLMRLLGRSKNQNVKIIVVSPDDPRQLFVRTDEDAFYGTAMSAGKMPDIDFTFTLKTVESELVMSRSSIYTSLLRANPYASTSRSGSLVELTMGEKSIALSAADDRGEFEEVLAIESSLGQRTTATFPIGNLSSILHKAKSDQIAVKFGTTSTYNRHVALVQDGAQYGASYVVGAAK
jgi:DNA polymerase III sliding clamp (beta) subunit (PCNA family)